jgi:hypothetical protein
MPWRVGKKVGRTLYNSDEGGPRALIGVMDRVEDAVLASAAPDLLAVAEDHLRTMEADGVACDQLPDDPVCTPEDRCPLCRCRAAIAKATTPWEPTR